VWRRKTRLVTIWTEKEMVDEKRTEKETEKEMEKEMERWVERGTRQQYSR
jgi:hypothetical protein